MKPAVLKGTTDSSHCLRRTASVPTKNASVNYIVINSVISCVFTVEPVVIFSSRFLISCYISNFLVILAVFNSRITNNHAGTLLITSLEYGVL
jgi:hypothetical protein